MDLDLDAIDDFTKAIEYDPANAQLYYNRAFAKILTGDYEGAMSDRATTFELIKADTTVNRSESEKALSENYPSLYQKYFDLYNELEQLKPGIEAKGFYTKRRG